ETTSNAMYNRGYGNAFIFVEDGIEFSVFPDGQFDFNLMRYANNENVSYGSNNFNLNFNSGYNYNPYVQYEEFGAIIQIENTPIFYDYYGRIIQAGNVNIHYNNNGYVSRVGGLRVFYNNFNVFTHFTGFINIYSRHYVYRPWHRYYVVPAPNYCVVYNRPYRRYYEPVRYVYTRPFYNNYRPRTAVATRRGDVIARNRSYATVNRSSRNVTRVNDLARRSADTRGSQTVNRNNAGYSRTADAKKQTSSNQANRRSGTINNAPQTRSQGSSNNAARRDNSVSRNNAPNVNNNRIRESVNRNMNPNNSRIQNSDIRKNNSNVRKPNESNSRIYTQRGNTTRSTPQASTRQYSPNNNKTVRQAPKRTEQSTARTTPNRENSRNDIQSSRRRF